MWAYVALVVLILAWSARRRRDPTEFTTLAFEPRISVARFAGYRDVDPVDYDDAIAAVLEFSRLYQTTHLEGCDIAKTVKLMDAARRSFCRNMRRVRFWMPNSAADETQLLAGIAETDAAMARTLADVAQRFPQVRLLYGAGLTPDPFLRSVDDYW